MTERRLVIAGTGSGVGKTTLTIGLMAALKQKGYVVQGFKCGPDYIDPTYHTAVTGRRSRNIDSWMLEHEVVQDIVSRASEGADISIIEGVMGFFDGKSPLHNQGSTAEISMITDSPVILVVNCAAMARSAAAIVKGFQSFAEGPRIVGVIANRVGSEGHYKLVKAAIEQECGVPVVGYLKKEGEIEIPERHLGLVPSIERGELEPFFQQLGELIGATVDLEQILTLAETSSIAPNPHSIFQVKTNHPRIRMAIARDAAFNFYYQENIELLEAAGVECVYFSPLKGEALPNDVAGLYLGGGFPEEFAAELAAQEEVKESIRQAIRAGMPTLAECGGFMYLTESIETRQGEAYSMVGVVPGQVKMQSKLAALGYREITGEPGNFLLTGEEQAKGHEFHYSTFEAATEITPAYQTKGMRGMKKEGIMQDNLVAGYTHFHFASCPALVERWIQACEEWKAHA